MNKNPLKKLIIDTKKRIFEVQLGDKKYIVNGKDYVVAAKKAYRQHSGGIGALFRIREVKLDEKNHRFKNLNGWGYVDSQYMFNKRVEERIGYRK